MCQIYQHPAEELLENVSIAVQEVSFMKLYQELRFFFLVMHDISTIT